MEKILSIILTIFLISNVLCVSTISPKMTFSKKSSSLDEYDFVSLVPEIFSSLTDYNNPINKNQILYNKGRIYGFIRYSNGSNVVNSTVLLWEGLPWGFSNMPDHIANTDSNGYYEFENLSYGRYHLDPGKIGFKIGEKIVIINEEKPEQRIDFTALNGKIYHQSLIILLLILLFIIIK